MRAASRSRCGALSLSERLERALYLMDSRDIRAVYSAGGKFSVDFFTNLGYTKEK